MLEKPSTLGRFGTQHVAIVAQFTILSCGTHQKESYFQESNISDANWLRYFAFIYLVECMTSSRSLNSLDWIVANLIILAL